MARISKGHVRKDLTALVTFVAVAFLMNSDQLYQSPGATGARGSNSHRNTVPKEEESYPFGEGDIRDDVRNRGHRKMSIGLGRGQCIITPPKISDEIINRPTFVASYPGSGSKMTWRLVEAMTGIATGDEHRLNGVPWRRAASVKTHYPHDQGNLIVGKHTDNEIFPHAVLMIRHPMNAIPGYHNFIYEQENQLPGHSTRAPVEEWVEWRDWHVKQEINKWRYHTQYWMDRYDHDDEILVLSYEGMTHEHGGPAYTEMLADFLRKGNNIDMIERNAMPCIWQKIIGYRSKEDAKKGGEGGGGAGRNATAAAAGNRKLWGGFDPQSKRRGDNYRPYTEEQLDAMDRALEALKKRYKGRKLEQILDAYRRMLRQ